MSPARIIIIIIIIISGDGCCLFLAMAVCAKNMDSGGGWRCTGKTLEAVAQGKLISCTPPLPRATRSPRRKTRDVINEDVIVTRTHELIVIIYRHIIYTTAQWVWSSRYKIESYYCFSVVFFYFIFSLLFLVEFISHTSIVTFYKAISWFFYQLKEQKKRKKKNEVLECLSFVGSNDICRSSAVLRGTFVPLRLRV